MADRDGPDRLGSAVSGLAQRAADAPPAIEWYGVEVRASGSGRRRVLLAVPELAVAPGEMLALVGPNGAGKTTLLHVAALLRRPDAGEVRIGGVRSEPRRERTLRRELALVFQAPLLFDVSVLENAASGPRFRGTPRREAERAALAWLDRFGVAHLAKRGARSLSGGEAQRVSLARAFATAPRLLLLDEPFAALDAPTRAALLPTLRAELRATGTAALLVTHDLGEALALGDRLGVLLGGRLAQLGAPAVVLARPASVAVARFLGFENLLPARVVGNRPAGTVVMLAAGDEAPSPSPSPEFGGGETTRSQPPAASSRRAVPRRDPIVVASGSECAPGGECALGVGADAVVALRASDIDLRPPESGVPPGWNALPGRVVAVTPSVGGARVSVDVGVTLSVVVPRSFDGGLARPGAAVVAAFPAAVAALLPG